jgi:hypothetical protein
VLRSGEPLLTAELQRGSLGWPWKPDEFAPIASALDAAFAAYAAFAEHAPARRNSILPEIESTEDGPTTQSVMASRGQSPPTEIYDLP